MASARSALVLLALLNWKSLPTVHHLRLLLYYAGLRIRTLNLTDFGYPEAVGQHPLQVVSTTKHLCQLDECDGFGFHKNNASYSIDFDLTRFQQVMRVMSILFGTGGYGIASSKAYTFLREIKPYSRYDVEIRIAAWDDKWIYYSGSWISRGPKGARRLHAMALERTFLFMGRGQKRIKITRVLALCGLGECLGARNWEKAKRLQSEGKATAWLREELEAEIDLSELTEIRESQANRSMITKCEHILGSGSWKGFSEVSEAFQPASKL